jgi:AraC-like DNA-binding protein/mannose-6-phosphate isomerase-like protein (cupin superfamily)
MPYHDTILYMDTMSRKPHILQASACKKTTSSEERVYADLMHISQHFPLLLCRVNYSKAHRPLEWHVHEECMEFVYVVKGKQFYTVGEQQYEVNSGEMFFTHAGEPHSTSGYPEDKSLFYYMIINIKELAAGFIGYDEADGQAICSLLGNLNQRVLKAAPGTKRLFDNILTCYNGDSALKATMLRNLISEFLLNVIESTPKEGSNGHNRLHDVLDYIDSNIGNEISLISLAEIARLSVARFKTSFRQQTGIPPRDYILRRKVEYAKKLLDTSFLSITDISYKLSFSSSQYFATVFKRFTTVSPSEYRKSSPN